MKNRKLIALVLLLALVAPLFAVQVTVEWNWVKNDPAVQYFRYQMDSESEDGWTVVNDRITNYVVEHLDGSQSYTLYLQQSYDGVYWSESASSTSDPAIPLPAEIVEPPVVTEEAVEEPVVAETIIEEEPVVEEAPVVEEVPAVVEEAPAVVEEEPVVVEEAPVVEEPVAVVAAPAPAAASDVSIPTKFTLDFGGAIGLNGIGETLHYEAAASIQMGVEDIIANRMMGWDIRLGLGVIADPVFSMSNFFKEAFKISSYQKSLYVDLMTGMNFKAGSAQLYLAGGARLLMDYGFGSDPLFTLGNFNAFVQPTGVLGLRYNMGIFHFGLEGQYIYSLERKEHTVMPRLLLGFTF